MDLLITHLFETCQNELADAEILSEISKKQDFLMDQRLYEAVPWGRKMSVELNPRCFEGKQEDSMQVYEQAKNGI